MGGGPVVEDMYVPHHWPFPQFHDSPYGGAWPPSPVGFGYYDYNSYLVQSALAQIMAGMFQQCPSCATTKQDEEDDYCSGNILTKEETLRRKRANVVSPPLSPRPPSPRLDVIADDSVALMLPRRQLQRTSSALLRAAYSSSEEEELAGPLSPLKHGFEAQNWDDKVGSDMEGSEGPALENEEHSSAAGRQSLEKCEEVSHSVEKEQLEKQQDTSESGEEASHSTEKEQDNNEVEPSPMAMDEACSTEKQHTEEEFGISRKGEEASGAPTDSAQEKRRRRAATLLQARYRGHLVRMTKPLVQLRAIAGIEVRLKKYQVQAGDPAFVEVLRKEGSKAKLEFDEGTLRLLLQLDNIQGSYPAVRQIRKAVVREIVALQEKVDGLLARSRM